MKYRKAINIKIFSGTVITVLALSDGISFNNNFNYKQDTSNETTNCLTYKEPMNLQNTTYSTEKIEFANNKSIEDSEKTEKEKVLNNFYECDSIEKIYKRQSELENLDLTDEDKIYKNCKLSAPLQHFIYEQSIINEVPFDFLMSIIYVETRGNFNSSGQVACNGEENYDLGLTQQNTVSSLPNFQVNYNLCYDDCYNLLKDNDYANVCSAFLGIKEIKKQYPEFNEYEYAGCYNGWLNWRNYSTSCEYVSMFDDAYNNVFTEHHSIEKQKTKSSNNEK